jgi:hypothetical protein
MMVGTAYNIHAVNCSNVKNFEVPFLNSSFPILLSAMNAMSGVMIISSNLFLRVSRPIRYHKGIIGIAQSA